MNRPTVLFLLVLSLPFQARAENGCECTDAVRQQELGYLRGALRTAWDRYRAVHPWAGNGWRSNAAQTGVDIINAVASIPGHIDVVILNTLAGENRYYVKPGPNFGVRCQQVFDGMLPVVMEELRRTRHRFRCLGLAQVIQDGIRGGSSFNHVYFGVVDIRKPAGTPSRSMGDVLYFADPWADGRGLLVQGIGYVPTGAWAGKRVDLGAYMRFEMPRENEPADCGPGNLCANALGGKYVFHLSSATWSGGEGYLKPEYAYTFNPATYLAQLAAWDYLPPLNGNPYALLWATPVQWLNGQPTRVINYAGGSWRIVDYLSTTWDDTERRFEDYGVTVVASGSLDDRAFMLGLPESVGRLSTGRSEEPTGVTDMSAITTMEVTCNGTFPSR